MSKKKFTFEDLEFNPRTSKGMFDYKGYTCKRATLEFSNGYGISVLTPDETGPNKYCQASTGTYEIALLKDDHVCYDYKDDDREDGGDDLYGVWIYQPKEKVEQLLKVFQNLPKKD